jgi:Transcriptional regulator, AbiEi antitoxin, Type IV TA system/Transcriptional regulator, AbiEi antitoxin N-terminal domain
MGIEKQKNIKKLLSASPAGVPITRAHFKKIGISDQLLQKYIKSGLLEKLGAGAYHLPHNKISWQGALYAIQTQQNKNLHLGGRSALDIYGLSHYLPLSLQKVFIFNPVGESVPKWFINYPWGNTEAISIKSNFLDSDIGIEKEVINALELSISSPERALFEVVYLLGKHHSFEELVLLSEASTKFRPHLMQTLLEACQSKKVKRLVLLLGKHQESLWYKHIDQKALDLGEGVIQLEGGGHYISEFKLSIPKALEEYSNV